jgi:hypothetical protein
VHHEPRSTYRERHPERLSASTTHRIVGTQRHHADSAQAPSFPHESETSVRTPSTTTARGLFRCRDGRRTRHVTRILDRPAAVVHKLVQRSGQQVAILAADAGADRAYTGWAT